ncbi:MAG: peptidoglycan bridge formation glycyltransferase FemA/FemB family protein [Bacillota bacterium]
MKELFRVISETEKERFDAFVQSSPNGHIFQSYLWGEIKKPAWLPLRVVFEESGRILAAASVLKRKIPLLNKSFFYLPRGPVLNNWDNSRLFEVFMEHLRRLAESEGAVFIKIDPCLLEERVAPAESLIRAGLIPAGGAYKFGGFQPRYTFRLDISKSMAEIMESFPKKIRYKIRYGSGKGLVFQYPGEAGLAPFLKIMQQAGRRRDFALRSPEYFYKLYRTLDQANAINLVLGYYLNQAVIGGITLVYGDQAWAVYGAQDESCRHLYAYHALIWERIKWAKSMGARWFDFYGVPGSVDESDPMYGLYYFKKSFGGQFCAFIGEKDLVLSPGLYWLWASCFPAARQLMLKLAKGSFNFRFYQQRRGKL